MMRFAPKMALGAATVMLALLDWTVGSTIAEPDGPNGGPPSDEMIPADASLEGTFRATAEVGSLAIRVLQDGQGYVLEATNPGTEPRDVEVEVAVLETTINPMARMGPIPREVASDKVALHCEPGQHVRRPLTFAGLTPPTPRAPAGRNAGSNRGAVLGGPGLEFFRTREFVVAAAGSAPTARPQRQTARAQPASLAILGRPAGQTVLRLALGPAPMPAAAASSNARANAPR